MRAWPPERIEPILSERNWNTIHMLIGTAHQQLENSPLCPYSQLISSFFAASRLPLVQSGMTPDVKIEKQDERRCPCRAAKLRFCDSVESALERTRMNIAYQLHEVDLVQGFVRGDERCVDGAGDFAGHRRAQLFKELTLDL